MTRRAAAIACVLLAGVPSTARAQTVSGVAEWTAANGSSTSDGVPYVNQSFWQRYTLGFKSVILDPRFVDYNASTTFRTNGLTFGGREDPHKGHANDFGYTLGASIFPARPFPFVIQASRNTIQEAGDYPSSSGIRGAVVVPPGTASPDFQTRNQALSMSWRLASPALPQVEVGYRRSSSVVSGGSIQAEQHEADFHSRISKDTRRIRQALTYQRTATDNLTAQVFNVRLSDLGYDFSATLSQRSRLLVRAGRRSTFSLFDVPSPNVDPGTGAYLLPSRGTVNSIYVISGVAYEPHHRVALDLTTSFDRQDSRDVETGSKLLSTSLRVEPFRGLSLFTTGTYGLRDQMISTATIEAMTRNVQAGATYRIGVRWINASAGYTRGAGSNSTPGGGVGQLRSWTGQGGLSLSFGGATIGGGYERAQSQDEILDFGNYDNRRQFLHAQIQARRLTLTGAWDRADLVRGRGLSLSDARQDTYSTSLSGRLGRDGRLTVTAGSFNSRGSFGHDRTLFYGGTLEAQILPRLLLTVSARYDDLTTAETGLAQNSLGGFAKLDYQLRLLTFALEYHQNEQKLRYSYLPDRHEFTGRQILLRVSRNFGFRL